MLSFTKFVSAILLMSMQQAPVPFATFINGVKHAEAQHFVHRPGARVKDAAAFEQMRKYILELYAGVHVTQSYAAGDQTVDCVLEEKNAAPGPSTAHTCGSGTIPMRRIGLEELTRFPTLTDYLRKGPGEHVPVPKPGPG